MNQFKNRKKENSDSDNTDSMKVISVVCSILFVINFSVFKHESYRMEWLKEVPPDQPTSIVKYIKLLALQTKVKLLQ